MSFLDEAYEIEIRSRFPRVPMRFSKTIQDPRVPELGVNRPGMPRPKLDGVPIPATSLVVDDTVNIIQSTPELWQHVLAERLCDLCAEPLSSEDLIWLFIEYEQNVPDWGYARGGMHKRCFSMTAHWCPHIRERLLDGTIHGAHISTADAHNPDLFILADETNSPETVASNAMAEYKIARELLTDVWPFKERS
jgi:hypothetical protein